MPYATVTDLQDRLGAEALERLTDLAVPPTGAVVALVAERALQDASDEIDGYLVGRYALPLASPPAVLRVHCLTLAHFRLLGDKAEEGMRAEVKQVREYLARVSAGSVLLVAPDNAAAALPGAGSALFSPGQKAMGREAEASAAEIGRSRFW